MSPTPGIYRHYKGGIYRLVAVAFSEADHTPMVVYHTQGIGLERGSGEWYVRPLTEFVEEIDYKGQTIPRFKFVSA